MFEWETPLFRQIFLVLEVDKEPRDPLILVRPFLCMAGDIIDVRQGRIDL